MTLPFTYIAMVLQANAPFFSNDWQGLLKVLGLFVTGVSVIIALLVKLVQGKYVDEVKALRSEIKDQEQAYQQLSREKDLRMDTLWERHKVEINGLGERVNTVQRECTERATEARGLGGRVDRLDIQLGNVFKQEGEFKADIDGLHRMNVSLQSDMTELITTLNGATNLEVTKALLDIREIQTRLEERSKFGVLLERILENHNTQRT